MLTSAWPVNVGWLISEQRRLTGQFQLTAHDFSVELRIKVNVVLSERRSRQRGRVVEREVLEVE